MLTGEEELMSITVEPTLRFATAQFWTLSFSPQRTLHTALSSGSMVITVSHRVPSSARLGATSTSWRDAKAAVRLGSMS
ncbi:hypothetical protein D3C83_143730 [compost metagenome]